MHGQLQLERSPGKGSIFWFEISLPVADSNALHKDDDAPRAIGARLLKILSVDDVEMNRELCKAILTRAGHRATLAADGRSAVALTRTTAFDIILMDVQMPGMDGLEATRQIRALDASSTPIIALTANVMPDQVTRYRAAGMNDHIGKPITKSELLAKLMKWTAAIPQVDTEAQALFAPDTPVHDQEMLDELKMFVDHETILTFAGDLRKAIATFPKTWSDGGAPTSEQARLQTAAHKAITLAGQLGFVELAETFRAMETACLENQSMAPALMRLHQAFERARPRIDSIATAA